MSENNDYSSESNSVGSDSLLQGSRWWECATTPNPVLRAGVLRPSMLGASRLSSVSNQSQKEAGISTTGPNANNILSLNTADSSATTVTYMAGASRSNSDAQEEAEHPTDEKIKDKSDGESQKNKDDSNTKEITKSSIAKCSTAAKSSGQLENAAEPSMIKENDPLLTGKSGAGDNNDTTKCADTQKNSSLSSTGAERTANLPDPMQLLRMNGLERAQLFPVTKNPIPYVARSDYVFGQNVHERVENIQVDAERHSLDSNDTAASVPGELMFANVIEKAAKTGEIVDDNFTKSRTDAKSLSDMAQEYEERRAQKRKFEEVQTFTGEEDEINIVDINCKLFMFVNSNWEERGRGSLRLNDTKNKGEECSRVVFRTAGNLRLLLNTKVWAGMVAERPSQKSLRLTAIDSSGKMKVYLVMARAMEINKLDVALNERINQRKLLHPNEMIALAICDNDEELTEGSAIDDKVIKKATLSKIETNLLPGEETPTVKRSNCNETETQKDNVDASVKDLDGDEKKGNDFNGEEKEVKSISDEGMPMSPSTGGQSTEETTTAAVEQQSQTTEMGDK